VPIIRDPARLSDDSDAVFYFPGCGSERLFSQIGLATQAMLYHVGAQCVLPPGYLCCGYPQSAAGLDDKGQQITTANRVLFHRVANTLNYLDIRTVIVSCGTCLDQLQKYEFEKIFPGKTKPMKADWFTGTLRIPRGKPIQYVHMGYQTIYEYDVFLRIKAGKVVDMQMVDNRNKVHTTPPTPSILDP